MPAPTPALTIQQRVNERRRKPELPLGVKLSALTAIAVLILLVGSLSLYLVRQYSQAAGVVAHTQQVQGTLSSLLQRLTDAETGQRGFLLTGASEFLDPYRGATADVTRSLTKLRTLVAENSAQRPALASLERVVHSRVARMERLLVGRRAADRVSTESLRTGKLQMDSVRTLVARMEDTEASLLSEQQARVERLGIIVVAVILPGTVVAFALLLLLTAAIRRHVSQRETARARIEEQNAELEAQTATLGEQQMELEQQLEESQAIAEELEATNEELQRITALAEEAQKAAELARDQFRASEARYRFLADTIPVQVWTAGAGGQLDFVSQGVVDYFGRAREEIIGDGWLAVLHADDISPVVERWTHSLATGDPYEVNFRLRKKDGTYRWHLGRALAQRGGNNEVSAWFGSNTDVDEQYQHLEKNERLVRTLERTNQELDQFAYVASHDLKAPLRGIANLSEWIEEDLGDAFPAPAREKMDLLRGRVRRLEALIDGILEYSRAGRSRAQPSAIDVSNLVSEVVEMLAPPASARVQISANLPTLFSERVPLQQVLSNLIGNALKYAGRADAVICVAADLEGEMAHFCVTDDGPGIAPQYHERIFVVFQRLAARDKVEGTGIGLAIVKKIVEHRGGRVWVESPTNLESGTGTTFHFTWPRVPGREQ